MPIIPRYQPRGGPRTEATGYAGAYQPPGGEDWRMLSRAAEAAGSVLGGLARSKPKEAPVSPAQGRSGVDAEDHLLAQAQEVLWRRQQLEAQNRADAVEIEAVSQSRREAAEALPTAARTVFESLTAGREAGFTAAAAARAMARVREASRTLSAERQALGIDEYHALIDTAPEQALAALGSAVGELGARLREDGADEAQIEAAQRALISTSQSDRVRRGLDADPAAAADLLEQSDGITPDDRSLLVAQIQAEALRLGVRREVGGWLADDPSLARDRARLMALADVAGDGDEALTDLYRGAALSELRGGRARQAAREAEVWAPVETLLAGGQVRSWTDLPARLWGDLEPWQQTAFQARTEQGWSEGGEAMLIPAGIKEQDGYPIGMGAPRKRPEPPPPKPRLPPRAKMKEMSEIAEDEAKGQSGTLSPEAQAQFDQRHENRQILATSPETRAFLSVIAWAEGKTDYNTMEGDHQGQVYSRSLSTAYPGRVSGRYQINNVTWKRFGEDQLGLTDYSDHSQDLAGVQLLKSAKIIEALESGDIRKANDLAAEIWACFRRAGTERSKYKDKKGRWQPTKTRDEVVARYEAELASEKAKDAEKAARKAKALADRDRP